QALSRPPTFPPAALPRPKIAPPGDQSQAPWEGHDRRRCSQSGDPSRTLPAVRRKPDAGGSGNGGGRQTAARGPDPSGRGKSEREWPLPYPQAREAEGAPARTRMRSGQKPRGNQHQATRTIGSSTGSIIGVVAEYP